MYPNITGWAAAPTCYIEWTRKICTKFNAVSFCNRLQ